MKNTEQILLEMCEKYQAAVNANDSSAYKKHAEDAIRIPPGKVPEHGLDESTKRTKGL